MEKTSHIIPSEISVAPFLQRESILSVSQHLSSTQFQVDLIVSQFLENATDWKNLAAFTLAGGAFQASRYGLSAAAPLFRQAPSLLQGLSFIAATGAEASTYELSHRAFLSLSHELSPTDRWRTGGEASLGSRILSSFVSFFALRSTGAATASQNPLLQHGLQDAALVLSQNLNGAWGLARRPQGTLSEQFLNAEANLWQIRAGAAWVHAALPEWAAAQKNADHLLRPRINASETSPATPDSPLWAPEGVPLASSEIALPSGSRPRPLLESFTVFMQSLGGAPNGVARPKWIGEKAAELTDEVIDTYAIPQAFRFRLVSLSRRFLENLANATPRSSRLPAYYEENPQRLKGELSVHLLRELVLQDSASYALRERLLPKYVEAVDDFYRHDDEAPWRETDMLLARLLEEGASRETQGFALRAYGDLISEYPLPPDRQIYHQKHFEGFNGSSDPGEHRPPPSDRLLPEPLRPVRSHLQSFGEFHE